MQKIWQPAPVQLIFLVWTASGRSPAPTWRSPAYACRTGFPGFRSRGSLHCSASCPRPPPIRRADHRVPDWQSAARVVDVGSRRMMAKNIKKKLVRVLTKERVGDNISTCRHNRKAAQLFDSEGTEGRQKRRWTRQENRISFWPTGQEYT